MVDQNSGGGAGLGLRIRQKFAEFATDPKVWGSATIVLLVWLSTIIYDFYKPNIAREIATLIVDEANFSTVEARGLPIVASPLESYVKALILQSSEEIATLIVDEANFSTVDSSGQPIVASPLKSYVKALILQSSKENGFQTSFIASLASKQASSVNVDLSQNLSSVVGSSFLKIPEGTELHETLKKKIRDLIESELTRIRILESEYGRVDTIFTDLVVLEAKATSDGEPQQLQKDVKFVAEKHQQILIRIDHDLFLPDEHGFLKPAPFKLSGLRVTGLGGTVQLPPIPAIQDITEVVGIVNREDVQPLRVAVAPAEPLTPGSKVVIEVTIVVRNALPGAAAALPIPVSQSSALPNQ